MMQMGPHPRAESEVDVGEEVVRFKPHLEANQPSAAGHSTTAQPPVNEESPVDPSCPAEWIHSKAGMAEARGSAWLEGTKGDGHPRLWTNRAREAARARREAHWMTLGPLSAAGAS